MKQLWEETLQLAVREVEGYPCIHLSGEGEACGAGALEQAFEALIGQGQTRVVLDTRGVRFLDPRCSDAIARIVQRLEAEGGMLVVVDQSLPVERTLKLLEVERLVQVVPTVGQATTYLDWHE